MLLPHHSRSSRRQKFQPSSAINVTPLVDVMLVLLIIFMVAAPMMTAGVPVNLPQTDASQLNDATEPLVISIDAQGTVHLQESQMTLEDLTAKLKAIAGSTPNTTIHVRADRSLTYGKVMEIMGRISTCGLQKISLVTEGGLGAGGGQRS